MWEPFREGTRTAILKAHEFVQRSSSVAIEPDHLLMSILNLEETIVHRILKKLDIDVEKVKEKISQHYEAKSPKQVTQDIIFSQESKRVIELGFEGARNLGHNHFGIQHLFYGILAQGGSFTAREWIDEGKLNPEKLLEQLIESEPGELLEHELSDEVPEKKSTIPQSFKQCQVLSKKFVFPSRYVENLKDVLKEICRENPGFFYDLVKDQIDLEKVSGIRPGDIRIGEGYDVHQMVPDRKLILGGVEIPYEKGLLGYSDADVLVHAIMDALLGASSLGDIGQHFPDTDEKYRGISSLKLLKQVAGMVKEKGFSISNLDSLIIAQAPKVSSYIPRMRENIAQVLNISSDRVNIKATTTEGLGFEGKGEGIAARCVCLIALI